MEVTLKRHGKCLACGRKMDGKIESLLASRDLSRTWIHVDLDAFYASVEELDDPELVSPPPKKPLPKPLPHHMGWPSPCTPFFTLSSRAYNN